MPQVARTFREFQAHLEEHELVAVDFTAAWCGPCQRIGPVFNSLAAQYPQIHFLKVDVDENDETAARVGVQAMPTFMFYHRRQKVTELIGASAEQLEQKLRFLMARAAPKKSSNSATTSSSQGESKNDNNSAKPEQPRSKFDPPRLE